MGQKPNRDKITLIRHYAFGHGKLHELTEVTPEMFLMNGFRNGGVRKSLKPGGTPQKDNSIESNSATPVSRSPKELTPRIVNDESESDDELPMVECNVEISEEADGGVAVSSRESSEVVELDEASKDPMDSAVASSHESSEVVELDEATKEQMDFEDEDVDEEEEEEREDED